MRPWKVILICIVVFISAVILFIVLLDCYYTYKTGLEGRGIDKDEAGRLGSYGDYFGGILNPILASLNILAVILLGFYINILEEKRNEKSENVEKRKRAHDLLNQYITGSEFIKARIITQEFLMPHGQYFIITKSDNGLLNMREIFAKLSQRYPEQSLKYLRFMNEGDNAQNANDYINNARFAIGLLPSFFWMVDQEYKKGLLPDDIANVENNIFAQHYCWYWTHIYKFRVRDIEHNPEYKFIEWLAPKAVLEESEKLYYNYFTFNLSMKQRLEWIPLVGIPDQPKTQ